MAERRLVYSVALALLAAVVSVLGYYAFRTNTATLRIAFLDVGQGDAIFIETPSGKQILIDGGPDDAVLSQLGRVMRPWDHTIDVVIATHGDADHIAGLVDVVSRFSVDTFVYSDVLSKTAVEDALDTAAIRANRRVTAHQGDRVVTSDGVVLDILAPFGENTSDDTNERSIVARLSYGEFSVMLTGDAPQDIEAELVHQYGTRLESELLKVGHHGSRTSTDDDFVRNVSPYFGIISAGIDNRYGHPHQEPLDTLRAAGVQILGTYDEGMIVFESDGKRFWRK